MKTCKALNCKYPVFSHGYCKNHQYLREDKPMVLNKPRKPIKKLSDKRKEMLAIYNILKMSAVLEARKIGSIKCFVCGDTIYGTPDWHHIDGREEEQLIDKEHLVFVHRKCHRKIHDMTMDKMKLEPWFDYYMTNLKLNYPAIYERKTDKATLISTQSW